MSENVIEKKLKWKVESSEESEPSEVFSFDPKAAECCVCSEDPSVLELSMDTGAIDMAFPENPKSEFIEKFCLPPSYYTLSGKERLILLFAENFRRQFVINYPNKRPLVLAVKNACGVQKFVCNTIRPTGFLFPKLIGSLEEISSFVADFISYEPLQNPIALPPRLYSPDMLLRLRRGNSYEMATLLVSMLIGAGFPAMVVSGTARREATLNDQREVVCPYIPEEKSGNVEKNAAGKTENKYVLREPPDLTSHLERELAEIQDRRDREARRLKEEEERRLAEAMEEQSDDRYFKRRSHAWVAILENAPWSVKPRAKTADDAIEDDADQLRVFFIEPTTGFKQEVTCKSYIRVESMWNNFNYYVNRQDVPIKLMRWDVTNINDWEHFLAGEPPELQEIEVTSEVNLAEASQDVMLNKHLDMLQSWVLKLHIGNQEYEERYPNQKKTVHYKQAIHERFSPYSQKDGKEMQLSLFIDDIYHKPATRWQFFKNRLDLLDYIHINYIEKKVEESFKKGRPDKLMFYEHNVNPKKPKLLHFYSASRLDALKLLEIHENKIVFHYGPRYDMCFYQEFRVNAKTLALEQITEKFERNPKLSPNKDIAVRHFYLTQNKIFLQFHYAEGAVTASTREFIKPPKPDYGQEIIFDPNSTKGYNANPYEERVSDVQIYFLLLDQLKTEERLKKEYDRRMDEIDKILESRKAEMKTPKLMFSLFDPLRNEAARKIRMLEFEEAETRKQLVLSKEPDFLAPYLVLYEGREPNKTESWNAYNSCLQDLKTRYIGLLSELQRRYEDLTSEAKALKKFLDKFHDQFDNFDYERLLKEKKEIELNKRMVQQRLKLTHEQAQKKYEAIKESLLNDNRLNLI